MNQNQTRLHRFISVPLALVSLAWLCLLPAGGFAQGTAFTYQGRLDV